jgi:hypothetical protein
MFIKPRRNLIDWVRKQLAGPPEPMADGPDLRGVLPTERFPCGALYPTSQWGEGIDPASEDVDELAGLCEVTGESSAEPAIVRRYIPPSSLGFTYPPLVQHNLCKAEYDFIDAASRFSTGQ